MQFQRLKQKVAEYFSENYDRIEAGLLKTISTRRSMSIQLDITNACNLACSHCYHANHSNKGAMNLNDWYSVLNKIEAFVTKYNLEPRFIICGGEPLISPFIQPIMARISNQFQVRSFDILTNGTIFRDSILSFLSDFELHIQVSLDGPDQSRHDSIRGSGNFNKSIAGIKKFKDLGAKVSIQSVLSKRTALWIKDFFENARNIGVDAQNFTRLVAQGQGADFIKSGKDRDLSPLELKKAFEEIILYSYLTKVPTNTDQPLFALINREIGQSGLYGYDGLIVSYTGDLKFSSRVNYKLGNLLTESLEEIYLNNHILQNIRDKNIEGCKSCELINVCGGDRNIAFVKTGNFLAKDPGCWI